MLNRRGLITGLISFVAAPAIVRINHLMPISTYVEPRYLWREVSKPIIYDYSFRTYMRDGIMLATDQEIEELKKTVTDISYIRLT